MGILNDKYLLIKDRLDSFFHIVLIIIILLLVLFGLLLIAKFTGYASQINSQGGYITQLEISRSHGTTLWQGVYGLAIRVPGFSENFTLNASGGSIDRHDVFFDCIESGATDGNEVYATIVPNLSFTDIIAGSVSDLDNFLNISANLADSANATFQHFMNVSVANTTVENIPATYTFKNGVPSNLFDLGLLNISGNLVFVTHIAGVQDGYVSGVTVNYQMLLPTPSNLSQVYSFYTDPEDECPAGGFLTAFNATVYGFINDTFGNNVSDVRVTVAGYSVHSNSGGFYNLTSVVNPGTYSILAQKSGYLPGIDNVTVSFQNNTVSKNMTLVLTGGNSDNVLNVTIFGNIFSSGGDLLDGVNVSIGTGSNISDVMGKYNITTELIIGDNYLIAIKQDYDNYVNILNINATNSLIHQNISMNSVNDFTTGPKGTNNPLIKKIKPVRRNPVPEEQGADFITPTRRIARKILENTFLEEIITIHNFKGGLATYSFAISDDIKPLVLLDQNSISVSRDNFKELKITLYGNKVGKYNGTLEISGSAKDSIPIDIEVIENNLPLRVLLMDVELIDDTITPGERLRYKINLQNLLTDQSYKVDLRSVVVDINNSKIYVDDEDSVDIVTSSRLVKSLELPENLDQGDYVLRMEASFLDLTSTTSSRFLLILPIYLYTVFGIPLWIIMTAIAGVGSSTLSYKMYRIRKLNKKRYHIELYKDKLPKEGPRSVMVGKIAETNIPAFIDLDTLTTHTIVAGATGRGKSWGAQVIAEEALSKGVGVLVIDPTAQWSGFLRKCSDKKVLQSYHDFHLGADNAKGFNGNVKQIENELELIHFKKYNKSGEIQIFTINKLTPDKAEVFIANFIREVFHSDPQENAELKTLLIFDEVHRLLPRFGGSGEGFIQIERACREFRKWGIGVMLVSQVMSDFVGEIRANISTEIQVRTVDEEDLKRITAKYGGEILKSLVRANVGVAMVQNGAYNKGRPYFVQYRPLLHNPHRLGDEDLDNYNKYNNIIEDLDYQIEQLEKEKFDVFDLKLELKLALDKMKTGNFNMAEIYIEGLTPRIDAAWKKLGKKPKKKEIKLVDESELKASIAKAKSERVKYEKEQKKKNVTKKVVKKEDIFTKILPAFTFDNGMMVSSLKELSDVLGVLDESVFNTHVTKKKNDIADWIRGNVNDSLADRIAICSKKEEIHKILEKIGKGKEKFRIDKSKKR